MTPQILTGALLALLAATPSLAQDRARATVACKPTGEKLTYDCAIDLKDAKSGAAIANAAIMVGADMPSMPMAHNVKPVAAKAGAAPGAYEARLVLEMHGDWAVHVTVETPLRDKLVQLLNFTPNAVTAATRPARPAAPGTRHHQH
jgi:hypothetical protein